MLNMPRSFFGTFFSDAGIVVPAVVEFGVTALGSRHRGNNPEKLEHKGLRMVMFNDFVDPTSKNPLWLLASRRECEGRGEKRRDEQRR